MSTPVPFDFGDDFSALPTASGRVELTTAELDTRLSDHEAAGYARGFADGGSLEILRALDEMPLPEGSRRIKHLERALFSSAMRHCAVMAGNSSAGIIEAASFGTPVVNIGDRQRLRERNANVTDVPPFQQAVRTALAEALFQGRCPCDNLWGDGHSALRIASLLAQLPLPTSLLEKANVY